MNLSINTKNNFTIVFVKTHSLLICDLFCIFVHPFFYVRVNKAELKRNNLFLSMFEQHLN